MRRLPAASFRSWAVSMERPGGSGQLTSMRGPAWRSQKASRVVGQDQLKGR